MIHHVAILGVPNKGQKQKGQLPWENKSNLQCIPFDIRYRIKLFTIGIVRKYKNYSKGYRLLKS